MIAPTMLQKLDLDVDRGHAALEEAVKQLHVWLDTIGGYRGYDDKFKQRVEKFVRRAERELG